MSSLEELKKDLAAHADQAFQLNYAIANDPELSGEEYHACQHYVDLCRSLGMDVEEKFTGQPTAFKAIVRRVEKPVFSMALLAEYDALPVVGHGCGHSANGAASFLAAAALKDMENLPVNIDLIGTPDEELRGGKVIMCQQDVFKAYDFAIMVHQAPTETTPNSHFLALDDYRIAFHGQTAHAASEPWHGRNALNGAMLALHAVDMLRQHVRPETRIGSYIVNGGAASNVIPDYAEVECCIRHSKRSYLDTIVPKIMNCFKGAAIATETTYDVQQMGCKYDDMIWNVAATKAVEDVLTDMDIPFIYPHDCGSSDIANVSHQCPAIHVHLALGDKPMPEHSVEVANAVKAKTIEPFIMRAAEIMGRLALRFAADADLRQKMKDEFLSADR